MCGAIIDHQRMNCTGTPNNPLGDHHISIGTPYNRKNSVLNKPYRLFVDEQTWKLTDLGTDHRFYCKISKNLRSLFIENTNILLSELSSIGVNKKTLFRYLNDDCWLNLRTVKIISQLLKIEGKFVDTNILSLKTRCSFPINNVEVKISPAFARIVGHILADGGIHIKDNEGKYRIFYVNNEGCLLTSFRNDVKSVFGNVKLYSRQRELQGDEIWLPTTVGLILSKILVIGKSKDKRIPDFILTSKDYTIIRNFLQAVFDDEGYLYPEKRMICISLVNEQLLSEIIYLLTKIGIDTNPMHIHRSRNRSKMFYFSITGKKNIINFYKLIGFIHPAKKKKLYELVNKYGD